MNLSKICVLPWIHLALFPGGHVLHCCQRSDGFYIDELGTQSLHDIFNHEKLKKIRSDFVNGKIPDACQSCFSLEDDGGVSWRMFVNQHFRDKLEDVGTRGFPLEIPLEELCYLDLRFSNVCNSSCRICGPHFSTGWNKDATFLGHSKIKRELNTFQNSPQLKDELYNHSDFLQEIYFSGGDPLLHVEHNEFLKYLVAHQKTEMKLCYNTNLPVFTEEHLHLWSHFSQVVLSVSVDATHKRGDYIRKGQSWDELWSRIDLLKKNLPQVEISYSITLSLYNAFALIDLLRFLKSMQVGIESISLNILSNPSFLSVRHLPLYFKEQVSQLYLSFQEETGGAFDSLLSNALSELNKSADPKMLEAFRQYNENLDFFRNEKFIDYFPEYRQL